VVLNGIYLFLGTFVLILEKGACDSKIAYLSQKIKTKYILQYSTITFFKNTE